ncbi:hypothetical protein JQ629_19440 [Bradyrhizobium sp. AUGA SZCCT0222]|uniref:methylamine utilization protein MauJ n=1 Tax=Bradyrhizobium sp. AUGA SZCCT0222 TaxID=2807668 RepID=UPI001BA4B494|nr:methylamine utilization protein MauJ [Bradyrhizobium sp. AUGA SZCCT0222]MBR1269688.1 hypothetical protein [Bradyrhizobium sp. AUGA SZCCT0222]
MKKWLADYRIESKLTFLPDTPPIKIQIGESEITISNSSQDDPPNESLAAQILVLADDISSAEALALTKMREFLHLLSFTTAFGFRISRKRFIMDWSPGVVVREQYAYGHDDEVERWPDLKEEYFSTVQEIERSPHVNSLRTALRWYASATHAAVPEDQFQYFWFVLELLAEITKEKQLVADKCQACHSDLYCPKCESVSQHRPFAKQAIEALLTRLNVAPERQRDLFRIRNGIMHGDTREKIEADLQRQTPEFEIALAVDFIGQTAFLAIFNSFGVKQSQMANIVFGSPDSYVSRRITMKAHMMVGMHGDPEKPLLENVVLPKITAIKIDAEGNPLVAE